MHVIIFILTIITVAVLIKRGTGTQSTPASTSSFMRLEVNAPVQVQANDCDMFYEEKLRFLEAANAARMPITLTYWGGSTPGRQRTLELLCVGRNSVTANDVTDAGNFKTFSIGSMQICGHSPNGACTCKPSSSSFKDAQERTKHEFEHLGWAVKATDVDIGIHEHIKTGKRLRTVPTAYMRHYPDNERPFYVRFPAKGRRFVTPGTAAEWFIAEAKELNPQKARP